jgi:TPR repeat protein
VRSKQESVGAAPEKLFQVSDGDTLVIGFPRSPDLKRLYRAVAKSVHPDFARDELDRHQREHFMKRANAAYKKGDLKTLKEILKQCELSSESLHDVGALATDADGWCEQGVRLWKERRYKAAVQCFERGLQLKPDHVTLQFYLGLAYYQGLGVSQTDYARAVLWWQKAAERGNAEAQNNLGQAYEAGHGVTQDDRQAAYWYRKAAEQNHPTSQFNLGILYELGRGVPQDLARAAGWYCRAAEQGYAPAQLNLGIAYELGQGVPQDYAKAALWYREAAESGQEAAREALWEVLRKIPECAPGGAASGQ